MTSDELVYRHRLDIFKKFLEQKISVVELYRKHNRSRIDKCHLIQMINFLKFTGEIIIWEK